MQYSKLALELSEMNKLRSYLGQNTEPGLLSQASTQELALLQCNILPYQQVQTEDPQPTLHKN